MKTNCINLSNIDDEILACLMKIYKDSFQTKYLYNHERFSYYISLFT